MTMKQVRVAATAVAAALVGAVGVRAKDSVPSSSGWRFTVGDKAERAEPACDDARWQAISVDRI